jgi:hypothetical protein
MPSFVHIADERYSASIVRTGPRLPKVPERIKQSGHPVGVFAMPVVQKFLLSHQWVRELKRRGHRTAVGVYFRVESDEPVWVGLYNETKRQITAGAAFRELSQMNSFGFEVIVPRSIPSKDITSIRNLRQTLGWRFYPDAHVRGIFCGCEYCMRGEIRGRKIRDRYEAGKL